MDGFQVSWSPPAGRLAVVHPSIQRRLPTVGMTVWTDSRPSRGLTSQIRSSGVGENIMGMGGEGVKALFLQKSHGSMTLRAIYKPANLQ